MAEERQFLPRKADPTYATKTATFRLADLNVSTPLLADEDESTSADFVEILVTLMPAASFEGAAPTIVLLWLRLSLCSFTIGEGVW